MILNEAKGCIYLQQEYNYTVAQSTLEEEVFCNPEEYKWSPLFES